MIPHGGQALPEEGPDVWPPYQKGDNLPGAGTMGMGLYILSLLVPFVCAIIAYFITRAQVAGEVGWPPANAPALPSILWVNTLLVVATSVLVEWSRRAAREESQEALKRSVWATLVAGVAFLICQTIAFATFLGDQYSLELIRNGALPRNLTIMIATYYLLLGLHALHVLGGVIVQIVVIVRATKGHYRFYHHPGITYSAWYWHFVGAMWLLVFGTLLIGNG